MIENGSNDFILERNNNLIRIVFPYRIPFSKLNMSANDFIGHHVCQSSKLGKFNHNSICNMDHRAF